MVILSFWKLHCANEFTKCSTKVIINWVIFTKSWHSFFQTRFTVHCFPTWRSVFTSGEGVKTDRCIFVVFPHLNIWHLQYLSSCTSATIEDQIGGLKRCQCHDKDVCVLELIACFASTNSLKSASSCVDIRLCMELRPDIDNRWQYPSVTGNSLLFSVNLMFSFCYQ